MQVWEADSKIMSKSRELYGRMSAVVYIKQKQLDFLAVMLFNLIKRVLLTRESGLFIFYNCSEARGVFGIESE